MDVEKVGKLIANLRKLHGMTQKDLAKRLGVSDKAVSKWERGLGIPDVSLLAKLSIVLDTDIESILEGNLFHSQQSWCGVLLLDADTKPGVYAGTYIYDKPLVYYQLSNFLLVGIRDILIVSNEKDAQFISSDLRDGAHLGITLHYLSAADYTDDSIQLFSQDRNTMVLYGYNVIYGVDLTKNFQRMMDKENPVTAMALNYASVDERSVVYDDERRILSGKTKPHNGASVRYYLLPFFFYKNDYVKEIRNNYLDEYDRLVKQKLLYADPIGRGMVTFQVNFCEQVLRASEFIKIVQMVQRDKVAQLQDIALRRGLIKGSE